MGYISCVLHVVHCVCESNNRRDVSTAVHARRMPQTKQNNMEMENGIQQRSVQHSTENCILDVYWCSLPLRLCCYCRYRYSLLDKSWYLVSMSAEFALC